MTGKWKAMGKDSQRDVMVCPACKGIFIHRRNRRCPFCGVLLVYPGEGVSSESEGYIWHGGKFVKISELKPIIESKVKELRKNE